MQTSAAGYLVPLLLLLSAPGCGGRSVATTSESTSSSGTGTEGDSGAEDVSSGDEDSTASDASASGSSDEGEEDPCELCLAQSASETVDCQAACPIGDACASGGCRSACISEQAARDVACLDDPSCPPSPGPDDSMCKVAWDDCIVCEDLVAPCFEQADCDSKWCEDWLAACSVPFCNEVSVPLPYQGSCTLTLWGIERLSTDVGEILLNGQAAKVTTNCAADGHGYMLTATDEILFCDDACAAFEQAGNASLLMVGWCD